MGVSQARWAAGGCTSKLPQISVTPSNTVHGSFLAHIACPPVLSTSLNPAPCPRSQAKGAAAPGSLSSQDKGRGPWCTPCLREGSLPEVTLAKVSHVTKRDVNAAGSITLPGGQASLHPWAGTGALGGSVLPCLPYPQCCLCSFGYPQPTAIQKH